MKDRVPLTPAIALAWALATVLALQVLVGLASTLRPAIVGDIVSLGGFEAVVYLLVVWGVLSVHAPGATARQALGLRATHPVLPVLGLCVGVVLHFPAEALRQLVERRWPTPEQELLDRLALLGAEGAAGVALVLLVVACVAPLVEELLFRGALFGALCRTYRPAGAALISGVCFVPVHLSWRDWPALALVAAALGVLRTMSGSLLPSLALHVAFNTVPVLALQSGAARVSEPMELSAGAVAGGSLATVALLAAVGYVGRSAPEAQRARDEDSA